MRRTTNGDFSRCNTGNETRLGGIPSPRVRVGSGSSSQTTRGHAAADAAAQPTPQNVARLFDRAARQFVFFGASVVLAVVGFFFAPGGLLSAAGGVFFAGAAG